MSRWRREALARPVASRLPPSRPSAVRRPDVHTMWTLAAGAVVVGTVVFNFLLAFVNTRLFGVSQNLVMLAELVLISATLVLAVDRRAGLYTLLAVYLAYMLLILSLRPELDLKAIRDGLIPIAFYFLGRKMIRIEDVDRVVLACAGIVVAIGLFEYFLLDAFIANVNVLKYYIARGSLDVGDQGHGRLLPVHQRNPLPGAKPVAVSRVPPRVIGVPGAGRHGQLRRLSGVVGAVSQGHVSPPLAGGGRGHRHHHG